MPLTVLCCKLVLVGSFLLTIAHGNTCSVRSLTKMSSDDQRMRHPPLLYWFPGVSAEWVKFLVEQATGHYTGSVVGFGPRAKGPRDCGLHSILCDGTIEDVKIVSSAAVVPIAVTNRRRHRRTIGNGLEYGFRRFILLIFDPYRAMLDDFISSNGNSKDNDKDNGIKGMNTSTSTPSLNVTAFSEHVLHRATEYQQTMELFLEHVLREIPPNNITIVRYDHLLNPELRLQTLAQMLDFLKFPVDNERLRCAFAAAETTIFPQLLPAAHSNTISTAYQSLPQSIECRLKDQLHYFMTKFNYTEQPSTPTSLVATTTTMNNTTGRTCKISERSQCATRYPPLKFIPKTEKKADVMLLSFPGSGNTWLRLLVEHATGYFSGSVDVNDAELMRAMPGTFPLPFSLIPHPIPLHPTPLHPTPSPSPLPFLLPIAPSGESVCDSRVVFVKGHPGDLALNQMNHIWVTNRAQHHKCGEGGIFKFTRAIYLVRDARKAMIADFQRHVTQSHTGYVVKSSDDGMAVGKVSDAAAGGKTIIGSRSKATNAIEPSQPFQPQIQRPFNLSEFTDYVDIASRQYEEKYQSIILPVIANWTQEDLLIIRFEDLLNRTTRTKVLQDVVNFLRLPDVDPSRLHCAFALANTYRRPASDKITATWAYPQLDLVTTAAASAAVVNNKVVDQRLRAHIEFTQKQRQRPRQKPRRVRT